MTAKKFFRNYFLSLQLIERLIIEKKNINILLKSSKLKKNLNFKVVFIQFFDAINTLTIGKVPLNNFEAEFF